MNEAEEIKKFAMEFFQSLNCNASWQDETLAVSNVPKEFEEFFGKPAPYYVVFSRDKETENTELMTPGSLLLKTMRDFMDNKGQTTLLRLDLDTGVKEEVEKLIRLKNCRITDMTKKTESQFFTRFTFSTTFQYLNEKEQILTPIYVDKGVVVSMDLSKYSSSEGKKEDIVIKDLRLNYNVAKEHLKNSLAEKTAEISHQLGEKLDKETARIKEHYGHIIKERDEELNRSKEHLKILESRLEKATEAEKTQIILKLEKLKEIIQLIEKENYREQAKKEEGFLLQDESRKHSLNINNKLINTTIIYYPVLTLKMFLASADAKKYLELEFNPLAKTLGKVNCESCKKELDEITLCSSGHTTCSSCLSRCQNCCKEFCKNCLKKCEICGKNICKKCSVRCRKCGKNICQSHVKKSSSSGYSVCILCLQRCASCGEMVLKDTIKKCPYCFRELCDKCAKKELVVLKGMAFCRSCSKPCVVCGKVLPKQDYIKCIGCGASSCSYLDKCPSCRKQLCLKLKKSSY